MNRTNNLDKCNAMAANAGSTNAMRKDRPCTTVLPSAGMRRVFDVPFYIVVAARIERLFSTILLLFCSTKQKHSMCQYYGHVVDRKHSAKIGPLKCGDCGARIEAADQLRKAILNREF